MDATRKGRPYDYSELPDLPGFAPIPVQQSKPQQPSSAPGATATQVKPSQLTTHVRPSQPQQPVPIPQPASKVSTS